MKTAEKPAHRRPNSGSSGIESHPDPFKPYGGFLNGVREANGSVNLSALLAIGLQGKAKLHQEMKQLALEG